MHVNQVQYLPLSINQFLFGRQYTVQYFYFWFCLSITCIFITEPLVLKYTMTFFAIYYILYFCIESNKNTLLSAVHVKWAANKMFQSVFKRISTPLSSMTNHVMHTCDVCNNNNNMQQHAKLFYPF